MDIHPINLTGTWDEGYALDKHIVSSVFLGEDAYGHNRFENTRSDIGELIYQFKYQSKYNKLDEIMDLITPFLKQWGAMKTVESILPVPSSNVNRQYQPVYEIAKRISTVLEVWFVEGVLLKISETQSKELGLDKKGELMGTIIKTQQANRKHNVLLVDDLFQSGSTLSECVKVLREDANVDKIYVLTMTKTKG